MLRRAGAGCVKIDSVVKLMTSARQVLCLSLQGCDSQYRSLSKNVDFLNWDIPKTLPEHDLLAKQSQYCIGKALATSQMPLQLWCLLTIS